VGIRLREASRVIGGNAKRCVLAVVLCLLATLLTAAGFASAAAAPTAVSGPPMMNGPVFNDPTVASGTAEPSERQAAVMNQLIRLIQNVPSGGEINMAMYAFYPGVRSSEVATELIAAHGRGVRVKVILDSLESGSNDAIYDLLGGQLGHSESAGSWVIHCEYPNATVNRGCIARNYLHSKFAVFSSVVANGVSHPNVVFQTSSNLTDWYLYNSYNDAFTLSDATIYEGYRKYFRDLQAGRRQPVNPGYSWSTPTGSTYRAMFYPRAVGSGDTIVNILRLIQCSYVDSDGVRRQTDIRLALTIFNKNRIAIANELVRLRGENCWIDVVHFENTAGDPDKNVDDTVRAALATKASNGKYIQVTPCRFNSGGHSIVPHTKIMMTDGFYDDDTVPRVYTGSANFSHEENSDDSFLRIMGRDVHDQYLSWFYNLRQACQQT
jgi:phosphatidylserine/phosphatidylglycerophosphate/cardiolipin synthase-like enzyme